MPSRSCSAAGTRPESEPRAPTGPDGPENVDFVMGAEEECLTVLLGPWAKWGVLEVFQRLTARLAEIAPVLPSPNGIFNGYGRLLVDTGMHIELSSAECDSPYVLAQVIERQHRLVGRALEGICQDGNRLVLANNNHSGLLTRRSETWGAHESYLTEVHPEQFAELVLPFLVTRIYAGAGGIPSPSGSFVACVRALRMRLATGGDTTRVRAIHSTAREESLMDCSPRRYRYHLITGDGHRSQFNVALQYGATALALMAIQHCAHELRLLGSLGLPWRGSWPVTMRRLNLLSRRGGALRVHPLVTMTQRIYLAAARCYRASLSRAPDWLDRTLRDWEDTLDALDNSDLSWLSARLDAFAKHALYTQVLAAQGKTWADLAGDRKLLSRLALLDQSYHEFASAASVFERLEQAGLLAHRVGPRMEAGGEPEPFVPETATRARARARFIRENAGRTNLLMEWSAVHDVAVARRRELVHPFAADYGEWTPAPDRHGMDPLRLLDMGQRLSAQIRSLYVRGRPGEALAELHMLEQIMAMTGATDREFVCKHRAWTRTQAGYTDGDEWLDRFHGEDGGGFEAIVDRLAVRTLSLVPARDVEAWIERGLAALASARTAGVPPSVQCVARFQEITGDAWTRTGRVEKARAILEEAARARPVLRDEPRQHSKLLATTGEAYRVLGDAQRARALLREARRLQERHGYLGILADNTYPSLAKLEPTRGRALAWLRKAKALHVDQENVVGRVRVLLLEARIAGPGQASDEARPQIERLVRRRPALSSRRCPFLAGVLTNWPSWVNGGMPAGETERFWRL